MPLLESGKLLTTDSATQLRVLELLGQGGNGEVYLVSPTQGRFRGTLQALKILLSPQNPERATRFSQELGILTKLQHFAITPVRDSGQHLLDREHPFLVFEYYPTTLRTAMRGPLQLVKKIGMIVQALSALSYLSSLPAAVVHRDVKPENFLVQGDTLLLGDFGLARVNLGSAIDDPDSESERATIRAAMPKFYRTPELVAYHNQGPPPDGRSDVFQLGLIAIELFVGFNPLLPPDNENFRSRIVLKPIPNHETSRFRSVAISLAKEMIRLRALDRPTASEILTDWQDLFFDCFDANYAEEGKIYRAGY